MSLPAAALRALVGAVTAARLSGVVLQRADWALSALAEAEQQVRGKGGRRCVLDMERNSVP